ncbi:1-deoxy-D-xylulose-5-phosphate reductoisomerase, partial [Vibrio campbellii]
VVAIAASSNYQKMLELCLKWQPKYAVMADKEAALKLDQLLAQHQLKIEVLAGVEGLVEVSTLKEIDTVMAAIVGAAGLVPTLAAVKAGKRILLANKEALVMSGQVFIDAVQQ